MKRTWRLIVAFSFPFLVIWGYFLLVPYAIDFAIRENESLYERASFSDIDWDGPMVQGCRIERVFVLYEFQTCYVRGLEKPGGRDHFSYILSAPSRTAISALFGKDPFNDVPNTDFVRFQIYRNGEVRDLRGMTGFVAQINLGIHCLNPE